MDRRVLLDEYFETRKRLAGLAEAIEAGEGDAVAVEAEYGVALRRQEEFVEDYLAGLTAVPLSRCPFTGELLSCRIDTAGLDGLWWDHDAPVRPDESPPATFFALDGAVKLGEPLEAFPHTCRPGPEAPFVVPRVLEHPAVTAVVYGLQVGRHQGFAMAYFARPMPQGLPRLNEWGAAEYWVRGSEGYLGWDTVDEDPSAFDYDLEPWIRAGKLLWIAPGDERMRLHSDARRCPYLRLPGRRYPIYIVDGQVLDLGPAAGPAQGALGGSA